MNGIDSVRQATVSICNRAGQHNGQGLLLDLDDEGVVVLTCHHVIAPLQRDDLYVANLQSNGQLGTPIPAQYDEQRSRPNMDAVVLRVDGMRASSRPFLHSIKNPQKYTGKLNAIGITYLTPRTFNAEVVIGTSLTVEVEIPGQWPNPPSQYCYLYVFRLLNPSDVREGISGAVVFCEGGVLGLVHFARSEGSTHARESFLVPLNVWADGWPKLTKLIEPLIDVQLRGIATIKRPHDLKVGLGAGFDIIIAQYQPDAYIERPIESRLAADALARKDGVIIIGKPKSGKTRLAWQLLQSLPEMLVVIPETDLPPYHLELSGFSGHDVILFFDDIHRTLRTINPLRWRKMLKEATGGRCLLVCTSRDGEDWKTVRDYETQLLDELGQDVWVFTSRVDKKGKDFSRFQGWELAKRLKLNYQEFNKRFDGTPGSLTLKLEAMGIRYEHLQENKIGDVLMSRLLDSAKLLYVANQPRLSAELLRVVAEQIHGTGPLSRETWDVLQRYTEREGFGQFDSITGEFQTYRPYLEDCVLYEPKVEEVKKLLPILTEMKDYIGLNYLSRALLTKYNSPLAAEEAVRVSIDGGEKSAYLVLGFVLARLGKVNEAKEAFQKAIHVGAKIAFVYLGDLFANLGLVKEAEEAYQDAIKANIGLIAHYNLGLLLAKQKERQIEAIGHFRKANEIDDKSIYAENENYFDDRQMIISNSDYRWDTNTQDKSEYYYSVDNQTFKSQMDVALSAKRSLDLAAYQALIDKFLEQDLENTDK